MADQNIHQSLLGFDPTEERLDTYNKDERSGRKYRFVDAKDHLIKTFGYHKPRETIDREPYSQQTKGFIQFLEHYEDYYKKILFSSDSLKKSVINNSSQSDTNSDISHLHDRGAQYGLYFYEQDGYVNLKIDNQDVFMGFVQNIINEYLNDYSDSQLTEQARKHIDNLFEHLYSSITGKKGDDFDIDSVYDLGQNLDTLQSIGEKLLNKKEEIPTQLLKFRYLIYAFENKKLAEYKKLSDDHQFGRKWYFGWTNQENLESNIHDDTWLEPKMKESSESLSNLYDAMQNMHTENNTLLQALKQKMIANVIKKLNADSLFIEIEIENNNDQTQTKKYTNIKSAINGHIEQFSSIIE